MPPNCSNLNLQRDSGEQKLGRGGLKSHSCRLKLEEKQGSAPRQIRCHHRFALLSASVGASLSALRQPSAPGRGGGLRGPGQRCVLRVLPLPLSGKVVLTLPRGLSLFLKTKDGRPPRRGTGRERERERRMETERGEGTSADERRV